VCVQHVTLASLSVCTVDVGDSEPRTVVTPSPASFTSSTTSSSSSSPAADGAAAGGADDAGPESGAVLDSVCSGSNFLQS